MGQETVKDVVGVLPHRFGDDERGIARDLAKDLHAVLLRIDETVTDGLAKRVCPLERPPLGLDGAAERALHLPLGSLALPVRRLAQVTVRNEVDRGLRGHGQEL